MKKRIRVLCAGIEAVVFLAAVYFEPTCIVRGTLRGEAFYDGKRRREFAALHGSA